MDRRDLDVVDNNQGLMLLDHNTRKVYSYGNIVFSSMGKHFCINHRNILTGTLADKHG